MSCCLVFQQLHIPSDSAEDTHCSQDSLCVNWVRPFFTVCSVGCLFHRDTKQLFNRACSILKEGKNPEVLLWALWTAGRPWVRWQSTSLACLQHVPPCCCQCCTIPVGSLLPPFPQRSCNQIAGECLKGKDDIGFSCLEMSSISLYSFLFYLSFHIFLFEGG